MTNYLFIVSKLWEEVTMLLSNCKKLSKNTTRLSEILTNDQNTSVSIQVTLLKYFTV